jgi:hypothetical protein
MTLKSISPETKDSIILIYPYDEEFCFIIYQSFDGECEYINLENIKNETKETIYIKNGAELC